MELGLSDKVAIVTGASRGIGRAIAEELARERAKLVLVARSEPLLAALADAVEVDALAIPIDLRETSSARAVVDATIERFGRIDVLVNDAGATKRGDFLELTDDEWADGFALKFFGAMRLSRAAWPHLRETRGAIVNVVGIGGRTAKGEFTIGGSVNAALLNLTKALADRGIADGVRVNAVNPATTATERLKTRIHALATEHGVEETEAARRMTASMGIARFAEPAEIARAVTFLASSAASFCQGAILDVDGGLTRTL